MAYGIPYKGSKNAIAKWILQQLPPADCLVDLFAGGCAITHAALEQMSGVCPKWSQVIVNDIDPMPIRLFLDACDGKYAAGSHTEWISREDFEQLKDFDPYVRFCWSFGNNGRNYMYSREIEPWKKAVHYAVVMGDFALLDEILGAIPGDARQSETALKHWIMGNALEIKQKYAQWYIEKELPRYCRELNFDPVILDHLNKTMDAKRAELRGMLRDSLRSSGLRACDVDRYLGTNGMAGHYFGTSQWEFPTLNVYTKLKEILPLPDAYPWDYWAERKKLQSLQSLPSLPSLQRLQRLQRLRVIHKMNVFMLDYRAVSIPENSVVYCDIPYQNSDGYGVAFDHAAFFDWACTQSVPVYVSSYVIGDPRFEIVGEIKKRKLYSASGDAQREHVVERLYRVKR